MLSKSAAIGICILGEKLFLHYLRCKDQNVQFDSVPAMEVVVNDYQHQEEILDQRTVRKDWTCRATWSWRQEIGWIPKKYQLVDNASTKFRFYVFEIHYSNSSKILCQGEPCCSRSEIFCYRQTSCYLFYKDYLVGLTALVPRASKWAVDVVVISRSFGTDIQTDILLPFMLVLPGRFDRPCI